VTDILQVLTLGAAVCFGREAQNLFGSRCFSSATGIGAQYMMTILGVKVAANSYASVVTKSLEWAKGREPRVLVFANVHVVMEALDSADYRECLKRGDIVSPDGVPLVWALKLLGQAKVSRVYGPTALSPC
jgi:UDP-N-acetyl-D-mannosaminuronic acid transferase (WecB/TagA/CpsF family)